MLNLANKKNLILILTSAVVSYMTINLLFKGEKEYIQAKRKRIQDEQKIINSNFRDIEVFIREDKLQEAKKQLAKLSGIELNREQIKRRYLIRGDIELAKYRNPRYEDDAKLHFDIAVKYYNKATDYCDNEEELKGIERKRTSLFMENKNWKKAIDLFNETENLNMSPIERWTTHLEKAKCLMHIGNYYDTNLVLDRVADECDDDSIMSEALRLKGDLLLECSRSPEKTKKLLKLSSAATKEDSNELETQAKNSYKEIIEEMLPANPQAAKSQLGLLKISKYRAIALYDTIKDLNDVPVETANEINQLRKSLYKRVNRIQYAPVSTYDKAEALIILANLERDSDNSDKESIVLEKCLSKFRMPSVTQSTSMRLYKIYKTAEDYENAFRIVKNIFIYYPDKENIVKLLNEFYPEKTSLLSKVSKGNLKGEYLHETTLMFDLLKNADSQIWAKIEPRANFIKANLFMLAGQLRKADLLLEQCINDSRNTKDLIEEIYFLDTKCSIQNPNSSPATTIARVRRCLNEFPKGKHYKAAMLILAKEYYKGQLYDESITTAKKIYIDELSNFKQGGNVTNSVRLLETIALMGQCYKKLNLDDKSDKLLKSYSTQLLKTPDAPEIFLLWSQLAEDEGQYNEAIRRIEVVLPKVFLVKEKAKLLVARSLLKLKIGSDAEFNSSKGLIIDIELNKVLAEDEKKQFQRELYEGLLEYTFKHKHPDRDKLLEKIAENYKGKRWPEYWILRSIFPLFGTKNLEEFSQKYQKLIQDTLLAENKDEVTVQFIHEQLKLIKELASIETRVEQIKKEKDL
jgi:hypothetical protein